MTTKRVTEALQDCEVRLRQSLAEAAQAGDYENVVEITRIVTSIVALIPNAHPKPAKKVTSPAPSKRKRRPKYPRFSRRGHDLVKTGWSKKDKKPYEHRAARNVVDALAEAILKTGNGGGLVTTEAWFPLEVDNEEVPAYQAYLCLAWLREIEFVVADGRKGYHLNSNIVDASTIAIHWDDLPEE